MEWKTFHHPDISLPVIRRKIGDELITLLAGTTELALSRGRSTIYKGCYPNTRSYLASVSRLEKKGLIAARSARGEMPTLRLTAEAEKNLPAYLTPQKRWDRRWNKWWYILMFDVPEANRSYRDTLRAFLKKKNFGYLQKSVWVTPDDVRADYDDLNRAAAVDTVAFLFEARTVLGFGNQTVVQEAWDFNRINALQDLYIKTAEENLKRLKKAVPREEEILQLLRMDNMAYAQAMEPDPLLPAELHPPDYAGSQAAKMHNILVRQAVSALAS